MSLALTRLLRRPNLELIKIKTGLFVPWIDGGVRKSLRRATLRYMIRAESVNNGGARDLEGWVGFD